MQPESHLSWLQGQRYTSDSALCHEHCSLMCLKPSDSAGFGHGVAVSLQEAAAEARVASEDSEAFVSYSS